MPTFLRKLCLENTAVGTGLLGRLGLGLPKHPWLINLLRSAWILKKSVLSPGKNSTISAESWKSTSEANLSALLALGAPSVAR